MILNMNTISLNLFEKLRVSFNDLCRIYKIRNIGNLDVQDAKKYHEYRRAIRSYM